MLFGTGAGLLCLCRIDINEVGEADENGEGRGEAEYLSKVAPAGIDGVLLSLLFSCENFNGAKGEFGANSMGDNIESEERLFAFSSSNLFGGFAIGFNGK